MPLVRVSMWTGRTYDQKAELAKLLTDAVSKVIGAPPEVTTVIFEDVDQENWAQGGILSSDN